MKLALATDYTAAAFRASPVSSWWWSEKLDGWRAYWDGQTMRTRSGRALAPPVSWTQGLPPRTALDGELYLGRGKLDELGGVLRSKEGGRRYGGWGDVRFCVFDMPRAKCGYAARYRKLHELVDRMQRTRPATPLRLVVQTPVSASAPPDRIAARIIRQGGEGIVLRNVHQSTTYVPGRSAGMLRLKESADAEARVVAVDRHGPRLRAVVVERKGLRFRIGSGFTAAQRSNRSFIRVGDIVTFRYKGTTRLGVPRHATYLRHHTTPARAAAADEGLFL